MTSEYSSAVARRYVDFKNPLAAYAKIPRPYVIVQRINLGLFAILGQMHATADWRGMSEEIWPFIQAPPSTPMGESEAPWLALAGTTRPRKPGLRCRGNPHSFGISYLLTVALSWHCGGSGTRLR
jgi:hypothetical protein